MKTIDASAIKLIILEGFIMFFAVAVIITVYLQLNPFVYPGLQTKINWFFALYMLFLVSAYYAEIIRYSIRGIIVPVKHATVYGIPFSKKVVRSLELLYEQVNVSYKKSTEFELMKIGANNVFQSMLTIFCILLVIKEINTNLIESTMIISLMSILVIFGAATVLISRFENSNVNY